MKINNYGHASLLTALLSWVIGVVFTILSWWATSIAYENYQPGNPKPESTMSDLFPVLAFLAFPGAIIATIFGIMALIKKQHRIKASIGITLSTPLFLFLGFAFWVAANGGV